MTRILILYNQPILPANHPDAESEHEILWTVEHVSQHLLGAGHEVFSLGVERDPEVLFKGLREFGPEVVFNLFEGLPDDSETEAYVAGILQWLGLPFTGSPFHTLCLAKNKALTKTLLRGAGLPTADFFTVERLPVPACPIPWPVIVKPALQDASVGLDQGSVVTNQEALQARVALLQARYGPPVLVERFIPGREFIVGVVEFEEVRVLPICEILFPQDQPNFWPIITYDGKWAPGTIDYETTPPRYPTDLPTELRDKLETLALQAYRLLGCRDYGRVDFRVAPSGEPFLLEVNPNPDFSPSAGLAASLKMAGLTHQEVTLQLVKNALARGRPATPVGEYRQVEEGNIHLPFRRTLEPCHDFAKRNQPR